MGRPLLAIRLTAAAAIAAALVAGCTGDPERPVLAEPGSEPAGEHTNGGPGSAADAAASTPEATTNTVASTAVAPDTEPVDTEPVDTEPADPRAKPRTVLGIDASHHQGTIDWEAVAGDDIEFAYLKATEGTTYTDPTFAGHREAAGRAGIEVGGYHYFSLCMPGAAQAEHFADVLGPLRRRTDLPPAVDLEVAGSCDSPPAAEALLDEVEAFLDVVEERTGLEPIVYLFPEFEAAYAFVDDLADHRQWVRRLGERPPIRDWWIWQRDDAGTVAGIAGPVDVNVARWRS